MQAPQPPASEDRRLAALEALEVLDTPAERAFDQLTRLAASILEVPIALVSLVDGSRQWFKSRYGLEAPSTPREVSFCGHVVETSAMLVVPDAHADARFSDNPLVTGEPRVRFYAGAPLKVGDDLVLGTLCAIDHQPRQPTAAQLEQLRLIADQVVDQLEARHQRLLAERDRRRMRVIFDAMDEGIVVQEPGGGIVAANDAAARVLGLSMDALLGRTSVDPRWVSLHEDGTPWPGQSHPAMETLRTGLPVSNAIMGVQVPTGERRWININAKPVIDGGRVLQAVTTFTDITALQQLRERERQVSRQEHLVTIGTLAAGVGHEINNPLAFILGNLDFCVEELQTIGGGSPSGRMRELVSVLEEVRTGADRIRRIVRGLRAFAREDTALGPLEMSRVIQSAVQLSQHELKHCATVKVADGAGLVLGDESRIVQILVNLLTNAAQAFTGKDPERNRIDVSVSTNGDLVRVVVADNGPGIPAGLEQRVFDPFFTTKPPGVGTGLGLSISRSLAQALGGQLSLLHSGPTGTSFALDLQRSNEDAAEAARQKLGVSAGPPMRVLVIDDEPALLASITRILGRTHTVTTEVDARRAVQRLEAGEQFELVLCDVVMPHLSGPEVLERIEEVAPHLASRVVLMSGGALEERLRVRLSQLPNPQLEKPFSSDQLRSLAARFAAARRMGNEEVTASEAAGRPVKPIAST